MSCEPTCQIPVFRRRQRLKLDNDAVVTGRDMTHRPPRGADGPQIQVTTVYTRTFQVMLQAKDPDLASNASIAAARLISLLPPGWGGRIEDLAHGTVLIIESTVPVPVDTAVAATASAMSDASLRDWAVSGCTPF